MPEAARDGLEVPEDGTSAAKRIGRAARAAFEAVAVGMDAEGRPLWHRRFLYTCARAADASLDAAGLSWAA